MLLSKHCHSLKIALQVPLLSTKDLLSLPLPMPVLCLGLQPSSVHTIQSTVVKFGSRFRALSCGGGGIRLSICIYSDAVVSASINWLATTPLIV